jgi:hypothetical protein
MRIKRPYSLWTMRRNALDLGKSDGIVERRWCLSSLAGWCVGATVPLRRWTTDVGGLNRLWMDILRHWSLIWHGTLFLAGAQNVEPCLDVDVGRIKLGSSLIGVQSVCSLVVARFVLSC